MKMATLGYSVLLVIATMNVYLTNGLKSDFYAKSCPEVESTVRNSVRKAIVNDRRVAAGLLRLHFHDCFLKGCDASLLINSNGSNTAEKDGAPNASLHAFYVINRAKSLLEAICPGTVSCADILALAARDAVFLSGGPSWIVPIGRKDGRISLASDTSGLPAPTSNFTQLQLHFAQRGLSVKDLVALSGGHTLGFAHCSSFKNRIHGFSTSMDTDPTLEMAFAANLRQVCPVHNKVRSAGVNLDPTPHIFDNKYYLEMVKGKTILTSDQSLLTDPVARKWVRRFAKSEDLFYTEFVKSMIKMSKIEGNGTEIRATCTVMNS